MAKRGMVAEPVADGLDELIAAAGPPEAPPDLGNFRPTPVEASEPHERPPAEDQPPEPAGDPPPDDEDAAPPPTDDVSDRIARVERENEFLRLAMQRPVAPAEAPRPPTAQDALGMVDQALGGFRVTPEDVETILRDPNRGAEYLQNGIRAAVAAGAAMAIQQARAEYARDQTQRSQSSELRTLMYSRHPELEPFADQVMIEAQRLWAEYANPDGTSRLPAQQLVDETARRTRGKLDSWGLKLEPAKKTNVRRLRPAFAEGSGGGRAGGKPSMSQLERDIFQLVNAR